MKKIIDYKHSFTGRSSSIGGSCRVRLFSDDQQSKIIGLCTHLAENKYNLSSRKHIAQIIHDVKEAHLSDASNDAIVWIEHQPSDVGPNYGEERFQRIELEDERFPEWTKISASQFEQQIGMSLKEIA
ncbi:hypothetical protein [Thaumasiovibrio subtropicus]|uniref:hypothetical protein n=1 Tax=Thaumasiovibrio subtropicus TaxID=1891207 RepID=UPI000B351743|nr:hypothetical protein [Thaumasiovibrio subtropicus]